MEELEKEIKLKKIKYKESDALKVFVAGGSLEVAARYYKDAYEVGFLLGELKLTYGQGGNFTKKTIMGESFYGYLDGKGENTTVIVDRAYYDDTLKERTDTLYVVDSSFDLTKSEYLWSDIILILPGGHGTLNEITSLIERKRTDEKGPMIIIYNKDGIYDGYFTMIENMTKENFIKKGAITSKYTVVKNIEELKKIMKKLVSCGELN